METSGVTPLCELAKKYGTDKCVPHNYTPIYYQYLAGRIENIRRVMEIGIAHGAKSLRMWEEFFPNAQIIGVDIDKRMQLNKGRVRSFVCDQTRDELRRLAEKEGNFDVIVEDGSHNHNHQIAAMKSLLPFLEPGGIYFCEDIWVDVQSIARNIPSGFTYRVYPSGRKYTDGKREHMMSVYRA